MKKGVISILSALAGTAVGAVAVKADSNKKIMKRDETAQKVHELYMAFDQWLRIKQEGKSLVKYFEQNNYKTVAIYGFKELGEHLYTELKDSDVEVKYIIDKNADVIDADVDVLTPDGALELVDVIVVTAIYYFDEIEDLLREKVDYPIVSLEDILYQA